MSNDSKVSCYELYKMSKSTVKVWELLPSEKGDGRSTRSRNRAINYEMRRNFRFVRFPAFGWGQKSFQRWQFRNQLGGAMWMEMRLLEVVKRTYRIRGPINSLQRRRSHLKKPVSRAIMVMLGFGFSSPQQKCLCFSLFQLKVFWHASKDAWMHEIFEVSIQTSKCFWHCIILV